MRIHQQIHYSPMPSFLFPRFFQDLLSPNLSLPPPYLFIFANLCHLEQFLEQWKSDVWEVKGNHNLAWNQLIERILDSTPQLIPSCTWGAQQLSEQFGATRGNWFQMKPEQLISHCPHPTAQGIGGRNITYSRQNLSFMEIKNYLDTNENENATLQKLWDVAKAVIRGKFIAIQAYLKKQKKNPK